MTDSENPRLVKNAMSFDNGGIHNSLIIGDNLPAMQCLLKDYRGKVDVCYIDPPYACDGAGRHANTNYKNKITRQELLSMLKPRLQLARELLSDHGVIFCSIDDRNQAYVKILMDEIFGERNFIETFIWVKNATKNNSMTTSTNHEYVLCFAKDISAVQDDKNMFRVPKAGRKEALTLVQQCKDKGKTPKEAQEALAVLYKSHPEWKGITSYKYVDDKYHIYASDNASAPSGNGPHYEIMHPVTHRACITPTRGWCYKYETMQEFLKNDLILFGEDETKVPRFKRLLESVDTDVMKSVIFDNTNGKNELEQIFGMDNPPFKNPKSIALIKNLLRAVGKDALVLDFFAGSGTTGQAVLDLNREDGGARRFILINNNEVTAKNPHGIAVDVTYERLYRVMNGVGTNGETFKWTEKNKPYGQSLDVYTVVSSDDTEN